LIFITPVSVVRSQIHEPRPPNDSKALSTWPRYREQSRGEELYRSYYVNVGGRDVKVCKEFFLATFDVSSGRVNRATVKQNESGGVSPGDTMGRYEHSKHRLPKEDIERAKVHIRSFPAYASHYTWAQSQKKYVI